MDKSNVDLLSRKLMSAQDISDERAEQLAADILQDADPDIAEAAMEWCRTGVMPELPVIHGHSPRSLDEDFYPSQTFTIMIDLRRHGQAAAKDLMWFPGRHRKGTFH